MKVKGNGQAKILSSDELQALFSHGFISPRDKALFAICLFSGCRISEALSLEKSDLFPNLIIFRKCNTKGRLKTREIHINPVLRGFLDDYPLSPKSIYVFPGSQCWHPLHRCTADKILKAACKRVGIQGASTHSFRRTALTMMHNAGIPLRHIQEISGHNDLASLQRYLEVTGEQKEKAVSVIGW